MSRINRKSTPLSKRLQELRENMVGVSMQDVADALHIPKGTYANWEMDRSDPPLSMLVPLANFYGVTIDDLLNTDRESVARHISQQMARLDEADQAAVMHIVDSMADASVKRKPRGKAAQHAREKSDASE